MKTKGLLTLILLVFTVSFIYSKPVPERKAKEVALNFLNYHMARKNVNLSSQELILVHTEKSMDNEDLYYAYTPKTGQGLS